MSLEQSHMEHVSEKYWFLHGLYEIDPRFYPLFTILTSDYIRRDKI